MLDELLLGGEVQETSKKNVLKAIAAQDLLQEVSVLCYIEQNNNFDVDLYINAIHHCQLQCLCLIISSILIKIHFQMINVGVFWVTPHIVTCIFVFGAI